MLRALVAATLAALIVACLVMTAQGRDDGRFAQSPNKDWFRSLMNLNQNYCCDGADGMRVEDPDWEFNGSEYRVKLEGDWLRVEPGMVVNDKNRVGYAIVWPYKQSGKTFIRCFLPGSGT